MGDIRKAVNPTTRKPKIVEYARVSTRSQVKSDSIGNQKKYLDKFFKELGVGKSRRYAYEDNGKSGTLGQDKRQGLNDAKKPGNKISQGYRPL
jgi:DNA invertase Pin-like site-specific DNA recombinase